MLIVADHRSFNCTEDPKVEHTEGEGQGGGGCQGRLRKSISRAIQGEVDKERLILVARTIQVKAPSGQTSGSSVRRVDCADCLEVSTADVRTVACGCCV